MLHLFGLSSFVHKKQLILLGICILCIELKAQVMITDSINYLNEIKIKGYYNRQPLLRATAAVSLLDSSQIRQGNGSSLLPAMNAIAGLRMEERSPGSYRLSIRGSLLRSPFGIRNLKFYMDDFPLTDGGGNTYLNLLDVNAIQAIEVYKGPEASAFGANTGGTILLRSMPEMPVGESGEAAISAGSYGLFHEYGQINFRKPSYKLAIVEAFQQSDGYRQQSELKRIYFHSSHELSYYKTGVLKAFLMAGNLSYQTPGGLTYKQMEADPRMARPASPVLPGAMEQQAAIYNKTLYGGISNTIALNPFIKHIIALSGSFTDFKNPFITNYEKRKEHGFGMRTFLDFSFQKAIIDGIAQFGMETSASISDVSNYENNGGQPGSTQTSDELKAVQHLLFLRINSNIGKQLSVELGSSLNFFRYDYQRSIPITTPHYKKRFAPQLMPKAAFSYLINSWVSIRASLSRGYAPPTLAEVRASDQQINIDLQAEHGWNKEIGIRIKMPLNRLYLNVNAFSFRLDDAIVRRVNEQDSEYFINSGGTSQNGIETEMSIALNAGKGPDHSMWVKSSYTFSHFIFNQFSNAGISYQGNFITGVPRHVLANSFSFPVRGIIFIDLQHRYTSTIPLNDANTAEAASNHLIDMKITTKELRFGKISVTLSSGINNVLNTSYSLGNDLNAAGDRYFNPAGGLNMYGGLKVKW